MKATFEQFERVISAQNAASRFEHARAADDLISRKAALAVGSNLDAYLRASASRVIRQQ
jgi:hypothetical protein